MSLLLDFFQGALGGMVLAAFSILLWLEGFSAVLPLIGLVAIGGCIYLALHLLHNYFVKTPHTPVVPGDRTTSRWVKTVSFGTSYAPTMYIYFAGTT